MSPLIDGKNSLEADGFFRNERGLKDMAILLAFLGMVAGFFLLTCGLVGFFLMLEGWTLLIQSGVGIVIASGGLQAFEAKIESNNLRGH
jgi:hypothetical protein